MKNKSLFFLTALLGALFLVWGCSAGLTPSAEDTVQSETELSGPEVPEQNIFERPLLLGDPREGVNPDFSNLRVTYDAKYITIYMNFYNPTSLQWGNPYIYLYDTIDDSDRDMIIFTSSSTFIVRRDKDGNGHFETLVYKGSSIKSDLKGTVYTVKIPKGVMPDIGSRRVWAYDMTSKDRVPDKGYIEFNTNTSASVTDINEGLTIDHEELEVGYDEHNIYVELDYYQPVSALSWGDPYVRLFDTVIDEQRYIIIFKNNTEYEIRQDVDGNGHNETSVYTGHTVFKLDGGKRYTVTIPLWAIPSVSTKRCWGYTMSLKDLIPNTGYLTF